MFLTKHQKYIKDNLPELNVKEFYIEFGFKTRENAETKFKEALLKVKDIVDEDMQIYIMEEYISDNFQSLDTTILDDYWLITQRQLNEDNILKRKAEVSNDHSPNQKKSSKDRRLSASTTREGIVDLSNEGPSGQTHIKLWKQQKEKEEAVILPELKVNYKTAVSAVFGNSDHVNIQYRKTLDYQKNASLEDLFFYKLLSHLIESHQINADLFNIDEQDKFSEKDYDNKIYARTFELLFSDRTDIKIKSGDTKLDYFKVDYRVGFYYKGVFIDVSNIEIGRAATTTKVKDDHHKVILEAKTIIKKIVKKFTFINPKNLAIHSLQLCGLKGDMLKSGMINPKKVLTSRVGDRVRIPLSRDDNKTAESVLAQLLYYKKKVENAVDAIKKCINENNDRRLSFEKTLGRKKKEIITYEEWIDWSDE